jgi:hypothetical protein
VNESKNKIPIDMYIVRLVMARLYLVNLIYYHIFFSDASHRKNRRMILMKKCSDCGRELDEACFWSSEDICDQCYAMNPDDK